MIRTLGVNTLAVARIFDGVVEVVDAPGVDAVVVVVVIVVVDVVVAVAGIVGPAPSVCVASGK